MYLLRGSWKGMIWIWVVWKCLSSICSLRSAKKIQNTLLPLLSQLHVHTRSQSFVEQKHGKNDIWNNAAWKTICLYFCEWLRVLLFKGRHYVKYQGLIRHQNNGALLFWERIPFRKPSFWCLPYSGHQVAYGWKKSSRHGACRGTHGRRKGSGKHSGSKTDAMLTTGVVKIAIVQPFVGRERGKLLGAPQKISS